MASQKFMGRGKLLERLSAQVGDKGLAIAILQKRGHLKSDGKTYTKSGMERNQMTAKERAIDRALKNSSHPRSEFKYDPKTNRARLK